MFMAYGNSSAGLMVTDADDKEVMVMMVVGSDEAWEKLGSVAKDTLSC